MHWCSRVSHHKWRASLLGQLARLHGSAQQGLRGLLHIGIVQVRNRSNPILFSRRQIRPRPRPAFNDVTGIISDQPLAAQLDLVVHRIRCKIKAARPCDSATNNRHLAKLGRIDQVRKHALKEFRRETHDTFDTISKSHPNGMFIQQLNRSDSPRGSHDVLALICAIPIEAIATSREGCGTVQTGDFIPTYLVEIIRDSKLPLHETETMRCIAHWFSLVTAQLLF